MMLSTALVLGLFTLLCRVWSLEFPWFDAAMLDVTLGVSLVLLALALLLRHVQHARSQKIADSRERQLQAMLSMFRVVKHELNNDMQVVVGNAELASMVLNANTKACKPVENIREAASLAIDRIQQLTVFSSSGQAELANLDLNSILRETVARLTNEMPAIVMFRLELDPLPNRVIADRSLLSLSLSYLIRLAGKSLFHGGEIVVRTSSIERTGGSGEITVTSEILIVRGLARTGGELGVNSRDVDRRVRFARVLEQAQETTKALVERSGATVMSSAYSVGNESLIKMRFSAVSRPLEHRELVLEEDSARS